MLELVNERIEKKFEEKGLELMQAVRFYLDEKFNQTMTFKKSEVIWKTILMSHWEAVTESGYVQVKLSYDLTRPKAVVFEINQELIPYDMEIARLESKLNGIMQAN